MHHISDGVHIIPEEHGMAMPDCNVYVIGTQKEFYLVDTGNGLTAQRKIKLLRENGFELTHCRGIICTHSHLDHTNGCAAFACPVHIHEAEAAHIIRDHAGAIYALPAFKRLAEQGGRAFNAFTIARTLKDGDKITMNGTTWHVLHTPGHTPGSICLYDNNGTLVSGDTLFMESIGRTDFAGSNTQQMIASLERLKYLHIHTLLPGHEQPVQNNAAHIVANIANWIRRLNPQRLL